MELTDFIFHAQRSCPNALVTIEIDPIKSTVKIQWCWNDGQGEQQFERAILFKELNYDEAITIFLSRCKIAIDALRDQ
ncbi:hypothetical protein I2492_09230 [Budviciaceae bacterium CWB-B4]|uniref:Uncharacterized protein n=1 Tax=Limnobaculum xujianqingii TaxID=2738837 RepID=A0A9D7FTA6_9GAMM|nr:hypothetical protein [Limnobaculum xujianqingii]MBK5073199.1 hypothetical protein [Limnobaculum xujianqingii]MBK5176508.1 hypothetical protein [Limnobaculum xujianqingii]